MMAELNEKAFDTIGAATKGAAKISKPLTDKLLGKVAPGDTSALDWESDADWAQLQQEPLRARRLLRMVAVLVVVLVVWAAYAEIDTVTKGEARVIPTRQVQIIQSVDGGVVEEIAIKEGDVVQIGQLLLRIDRTRFTSNLQESRVSQSALEAKILRLRALTRGTSFTPTAKLLKDVPDVVAQEARLYASRLAEMRAQISIAENQLAQRRQELNEVKARREQAERGLELATRELNATRPMIATGAVSEVEVLRLEREVARLRGDRSKLPHKLPVCSLPFWRPAARLKRCNSPAATR